MLGHEDVFIDAPIQKRAWRHKQRRTRDVRGVVFLVGWLGRALRRSGRTPDWMMIKLSVVIYGQCYYSVLKAFFSDLSAFLPLEFNHFPALASRAGRSALLSAQGPPAHILIHVLAHITCADLHKSSWCNRSIQASSVTQMCKDSHRLFTEKRQCITTA